MLISPEAGVFQMKLGDLLEESRAQARLARSNLKDVSERVETVNASSLPMSVLLQHEHMRRVTCFLPIKTFVKT